MPSNLFLAVGDGCEEKMSVSGVVGQRQQYHAFIGGTGRSGTTILPRCMTRHPDILYYHEAEFLVREGGAVDVIRGLIDPEEFLDAFISRFGPKFAERMWGHTREGRDLFTDRRLKELVVESFGDNSTFAEGIIRLTDAVFSAGCEAYGKRYWVEKTPQSITSTDILYHLFPDMRYIHMIRDPKDVACSYMQKEFGPNSVDEFIPFYINSMRGAWFAMHQVPQEQYKVISVERFVEYPEVILREVMPFFGFETSDETYAAMAGEVNPKKSHIGRWREELHPQQIAAIDFNCSDTHNLWKMVEKYGGWI